MNQLASLPFSRGKWGPRIGSVGLLLAVAILLPSTSNACADMIAPGGDGSALAQILTNRALWGADALSAFFTLPALTQAGEKSAIILRSTVAASTAFPSRQAAEGPAGQLQQLLARAQPQLSPAAALAWQGARAAVPMQTQITDRFGHDRLTRVVLSSDSLELLKPRLTVADLKKAIGEPEKIERVRLDGPSDIRPVTFTNYVYAAGNISFTVSSNAPGEISRVTISPLAGAVALFTNGGQAK